MLWMDYRSTMYRITSVGSVPVFNYQMSFEGQFINLENLQDMGGEKGVLKLLDHEAVIALDFTCGSIFQYNLVSTTNNLVE